MFDCCLFRWLLLYIVVAIFHIEWCIRKPLSSSSILYNNISIAQHHHTNNNPYIFLHLSNFNHALNQPYPESTDKSTDKSTNTDMCWKRPKPIKQHWRLDFLLVFLRWYLWSHNWNQTILKCYAFHFRCWGLLCCQCCTCVNTWIRTCSKEELNM